MNYLAPSILSADFCELGRQIEEIGNAGAQYVHIDVMDGVFVPSISFGMPIVSCVRPRTDMFLDVHMMVTKPERYVEEFVKCGADSVTIHVEACDCIEETLKKIRSLGAKAGLAINPGTPVAELLPYMDMVDMVLVMTVNPGFGGQAYIPECTDKIREVRAIINERGLNVNLEIDGGVNIDNLQMNLDAGANVIVAGSAVFKGDITEKTKAFLEIMQA
ncbi:MAG: ribulose-phosphate 3-epimerase [Lachnospiraceae bacterium]|nr:ribulose-phosphate 3-epimerase [Lachnospiraceae bacterium]MEE1257519.1 ribulose-phosphate 3-epimerase [Lachnospiraceae bacterium]